MGKKILYGDNLEIGYIKRELLNIILDSNSSLDDMNKMMDNYKYIIIEENGSQYYYKGYTNIDEIKDKIIFKFDIFSEHLEQFNKKDEKETSVSDNTQPEPKIDYSSQYKVYAIVDDSNSNTRLTKNNTPKNLLIEVLRQYKKKNTETNNTIDKYIQNLNNPYVTNPEEKNIFNTYQKFLQLFNRNKKENNTESKTYIQAEVYDKGKINLAKDDILQTYQDTISTKKEIVDKMKDDVQIMNRSIQESKEKDLLQNKIKITLSIIIILFAVFCFSYIIYNFVGDNIKKNIKSKLPGFIRGDLAESTKASFIKTMS